jgi:hypothetical protein
LRHNIWAAFGATPHLFSNYKSEREVLVGMRNPVENIKRADIEGPGEHGKKFGKAGD